MTTSESKRVLHHLYRSRKTAHASGGVGIVLVQAAEMAYVLAFKHPSKLASLLMWVCMAPFAIGMMTSHMRRRIRHNGRTALPSMTGMLWVSCFSALACAMNEMMDNLFYTRLYLGLLICSLVSTTLEVLHPEVTRGNGWIFGVLFTYLTLLFPVATQYLLTPEMLKDLYQKQNMAMVLYYNSIHNCLFVSLSFFMLSVRDSKIVSEDFCDVVGKFLWTFPQIPLLYAAIWRLSTVKYANMWLFATSILAGLIIFLQKRGWFVSTLKKRNKKEESSRFLGIFLRGLVWDEEHLAFTSLDPTPQYSWGMMTAYHVLGGIMAYPMGYYNRLKPLNLVHIREHMFENKINLVVGAAAVITTIFAQWDYYKKTNNGNRKLSIFSMIVMPLMNGVFESFYFFLAFDLGVKLVEPYTSNNYLLFLCGFSVFSIFSGVIHAVMWGAHVLPANYDAPRTGGSRTREQSESLLFKGVIPMSLTWLAYYAITKDMWLVILCHTYADSIIAYSVHLPSPWATHCTQKGKKV